MTKILTVVGARPQFIKAGVVSRKLKCFANVEEVLLHTGQHFDSNMSEIFFEQLGIPYPNIKLNVNGGSHGEMTGRMLHEIEKAILDVKPDKVLVYGDTNSTLAGALAAIKLHIPVAHIEAGLRSFNMRMPEEVNRILTDQVSDILFCPTSTAVENLKREGFESKSADVQLVGDVMQDSLEVFSTHATPPKDLSIGAEFILVTLHRAENTDDPDRLRVIAEQLNLLHREVAEVIMPIHPRTKAAIERFGISLNVTTINPVGYFEMLWLLHHCGLVVTDSGGLQKEAFFSGKACLTLRDETEWVELLDVGANELLGPDFSSMKEVAQRKFGVQVEDVSDLYGGGKAAERIAGYLGRV